MHHLGHTRSANRRDHLLHTPDTFIRIPLPSIMNGSAVVHASHALGANFAQYTAELAANGRLQPLTGRVQRFLYVLAGSAELIVDGTQHPLGPGSYAYLPTESEARVEAHTALQLTVIEKEYQPHPKLNRPSWLVGHENDAPAVPLMGDADLEVRALLPATQDFDFAVNTMTYQPGAALSMVEVHVMEHGLLMLAGGGIYRLGDAWYPVATGDFIWMAPFCPQWFGALGKEPAKYLIYKDFNRHPASASQVRS